MSENGKELGLALNCIQQTILEQLPIKGGLTESVFPKAERCLFESDELQVALHDVAQRFSKDMESYLSLVDFLLVELFPKLKPACKNFYLYSETAPTLKDILDECSGSQEWYGMALFKALEIILQTYLQERSLETWEQLQEEVTADLPHFVQAEE